MLAYNSAFSAPNNSTFLLKKLCDEYGIFCMPISISLFDKQNNKTDSTACIVYINDEKYSVNGIYFSSADLESGFHQTSEPLFNLFLVSPKYIDSIKLQNNFNCYKLITNDYSGIFYSNNKQNHDIINLSTILNLPIETIVSLKNQEPFNTNTLLLLFDNLSKMFGINFNHSLSLTNKLKPYCFATTSSPNEDREKILQAAKQLIGTIILKEKSEVTFDCAAFVSYLYMSELGIDIYDSGFGNSTTGKIMTNPSGKTNLIDETATVSDKINFINKFAKPGDILLFHRQSKADCFTTNNNWYPGHVGVFAENGRYIDARRNRGNISMVDMQNDEYMNCFVGIKSFIGSDLSLNKTTQTEQQKQ